MQRNLIISATATYYLRPCSLPCQIFNLIFFKVPFCRCLNLLLTIYGAESLTQQLPQSCTAVRDQTDPHKDVTADGFTVNLSF